MTRVASGLDSPGKIGAFTCPPACTRRKRLRCASADRAARATGMVLWTVAGALLAAGCGGVAWQPVNDQFSDLSYGLALAAPSGTAVETFAAALEEPGAAVVGSIPRFEIAVGASFPGVGDKIAGHDGTGPPPNYVRWGDAFVGAISFDVQIVRPPKRAAVSLAAGDTFFIARIAIERFTGVVDGHPGNLALGVGPLTYDDMTVIGVWAEVRTVLNPLDSGRKVRLYLQYGFGLVYYPTVNVSGQANWQVTPILAPKLGWRAGLGIEVRSGKLGFYAEIGIQTVAPPDVDEFYVDPERDQLTAQDFVTFPARIGVTIGF